jgi:hypothetical protein
MPSSSSLIQGISISVSDDDEATGKVRVRVRRKLHRDPVSARRRRLFRWARLGAALLLASFAVSLLLYESYSLGAFPSSSPPPPVASGLSRLDRSTRAGADGARKCKLIARLLNLLIPVDRAAS